MTRLACLLVLAAVAGCRQSPTRIAGPDSASERTRGLILEGDTRAGDAEDESAIRLYREAVRADPASVPAHLRYVAQMLRLGRRSQLREEYTKRVEGGSATDVELTMHERLTSDGSSSSLRRVYANASNRDPASPWWPLAVVEVETAEADAWNRKRVEAQDRGDYQGEEAAYAQARGALERGATALARAAGLAPAMAEVELYRGYLRATEGDVLSGVEEREAARAAALRAFLRATQLDSDLLEAWAGLGDARFGAGDQRGAIIAFREAVRLAPADPHLRQSLGVALHDAGRHNQAARQFRQAAQLAPWDAEPLVRLGNALADTELYTEALDAWSAALRRDPEAVEAHYMTGIVLEYLERYPEARAAFERYVELDGPKASSVSRRIDRLLREEER